MTTPTRASSSGCSLLLIGGCLLGGTTLAVAAALAVFTIPGLRRARQLDPNIASAQTLHSAVPQSSSHAASSPSGLPATSVSSMRRSEPEWTPEDDAQQSTIAEQRLALFGKMRKFLGLSQEALQETERLFATQRWMGQGNPKCTQHPMTRAECRQLRKKTVGIPGDDRCGAPNMVPIYNKKANQSVQDATVCIDQYEYPNIQCEYPITWVPAHIAHGLCLAQGKRLCDAHEWEGACAGSVLPAKEEYAWNARKFEDVNARRLAIEYDHNLTREIVWAYGPQKDHAKCATGSRKSDGCVVPTWELCGTNTYPAGSFPECVSPFGAYDLHGNAAEHMNLPMAEDELASQGTKLGQTEMKGSWFIFSMYEAHLDDCRWRAPSWHGTRVLDANSHMNYHLGFRCCKDLQHSDAGTVDAGTVDAGTDASPRH